MLLTGDGQCGKEYEIMKILLVWPNKDQFGYKPIGISLISAILKKNGHIVDLFDTSFIDFGYKDNTEDRSRIRIFKKVDFSGYYLTKKRISIEQALLEKLDTFRPDVVAVSALSDEIYIGFEVSRVVKAWDSKTTVLWGNKAATTEPERMLACMNIDYLCIGEGIEFLPEFLDCIGQGKSPHGIKNIAYRKDTGAVIKNDLRPYYQDLDALPYLDWSIFDNRHFLKPYDGKVYIGGDYTMSWGCPNQCTYCINASYRDIYGKSAGKYIRSYSVDRVIKELKYLVDTWGIQLFIFHDEDFCFKPMDYFKELSEAYRKHVNVPFAAMVNARNITEEKVGFLKHMNCVSVSMGIETGNLDLRRKILKRYESTDDIIRAMKLLNGAGIRTSSFNMLGIPFETRGTIMETIELNRKSEVRYPNNVFFFPYKGTELHDIAVENGMFNEGSDAVYEQDKPALTLSTISRDELIALRERFVLYVKMPQVYRKFIERSEKQDETGRRLTDKLFNIYDECVLKNNGIWKDDGAVDHLKELKDILEQK